ncbi:MAG: UDP-N-acetylmuramate--L-alanine ligase [Parcubacteria group bacterium]|nr:UDP-N-acetylmuramate--L-alanine ligase [Parcubacteria group bacterium]
MSDSHTNTATKNTYFMVGIGGIGMSALAQLLAAQGDIVTGSDRAESPVTEMLESKGIKVIIGQKAENVPEDFTMLIYSDAVAFDHPERAAARERGIPESSYFQMLGQISEGSRTVAIAGTNGKTTTTAMLAAILRDAGASPTVVVGSLVRDFGSNYLEGDSDLFVVEACEYQRHFLNLNPDILVITNIEFDHTDYFKDLEDVQDAFRTLMKKVPASGFIIADTEAPNVQPLLEGLEATIVPYAEEPAYGLRLVGEFNRMNARAASAAARIIDPALTTEKIAHSLGEFHGTWRRFEYKGEFNGAQVYDDYAHHPTAISETLQAVREKMDAEGNADGRILALFHPHLYSRTRDLFDGFGRAFGNADEVILAPIYAAREDDDGTVSSELLAARILEEGTSARAASSLEDVETFVRGMARPGDIIVTMGAGDIYKVADALVAH